MNQILNSAVLVLIVAWGVARNIIGGATAKDQFYKLSSELGEFAKGALLGDRAEIKDGLGDAFVVATLMAQQLGTDIETLFLIAADSELTYAMPHTDLALFIVLGNIGDGLAKGHEDYAREELGHLAYLLYLAARRHNFDINDCLAFAYDEIKDRKGVMYNGVFIKSTDERYESAVAELGLS